MIYPVKTIIMYVKFYQKPGCINNTKQIRLLQDKGHELEIHSIFDIKWTKETLKPFFGNKPLDKWINYTAPRIKNGEIKVELLTEDTALAAMIEDGFLIKRPLIEANGCFCSGFDDELVNLLLQDEGESEINQKDVLVCPQIANSNKCD